MVECYVEGVMVVGSNSTVDTINERVAQMVEQWNVLILSFSLFYKGSVVYADYCSGRISARYYDKSEVTHNNHKGNIIWGRFEAGVRATVSLEESYQHSDCKYALQGANLVFPNNVNYINKEITNSGSSFDTSIDLELIDNLNNEELFIPNWAGNIKLICSTSKEINKFITDTYFNRLFTNEGNSITFNESSKFLNKNHNTRTLYVNETDYIEYKYFPAIDKWIEKDFVTFD